MRTDSGARINRLFSTATCRIIIIDDTKRILSRVEEFDLERIAVPFGRQTVLSVVVRTCQSILHVSIFPGPRNPCCTVVRLQVVHGNQTSVRCEVIVNRLKVLSKILGGGSVAKKKNGGDYVPVPGTHDRHFGNTSHMIPYFARRYDALFFFAERSV